MFFSHSNVSFSFMISFWDSMWLGSRFGNADKSVCGGEIMCFSVLWNYWSWFFCGEWFPDSNIELSTSRIYSMFLCLQFFLFFLNFESLPRYFITFLAFLSLERCMVVSMQTSWKCTTAISTFILRHQCIGNLSDVIISIIKNYHFEFAPSKPKC